MSSHPRRYDALPALHRLSAFLEDNTTITAGEWRIEIMAGLRTTAMANLGSRYTLQGKFHFDPRANLSVTLPAFDMAGDPMRITFAGGAGWHTKTPTLDQLFPEPDYSITRGSTISRRTTNRNAVSMWKSSSTTPPITT